MKQYGSFAEAISNAKYAIYKDSQVVAPKTWQSIDVTTKPEMTTHEVKWWGFKVHAGNDRYYWPPQDSFDLPQYQKDIKPNLPWADDHFEERVCGYPLNPGLQWSKWPYAKSADKFRTDAMFNHTYAERYWAKKAGWYPPYTEANQYRINSHPENNHRGIRYDYGDLNDVVNQLAKDPLTRQAVLPVFFPEDTGAVHGDRVPCSIHYHFMARDGALDIFYYLRSCDFVRHFRDDIYLTLRLQFWVIDRLKEKGIELRPGLFQMFIGSLHIFKNDWPILFGEEYNR